jgi:hypothetical protein
MPDYSKIIQLLSLTILFSFVGCYESESAGLFNSVDTAGSNEVQRVPGSTHTDTDKLPSGTVLDDGQEVVGLYGEDDGVVKTDDSEAYCDGLPNKLEVDLSGAIFYGTNNPTHLPMNDNQIMAIGTFWGCSGLLITTEWVLTAAHCELRTGAQFCIGMDADNPNTCFTADGVYNNPYGDMTLVHLNRDVRELSPNVEPVPILDIDLDSSWIGKTAEAAGYGTDENGYSGTREFVAEPIVRLYGDTMTIDGQGYHGACFGDSGGPVMVVSDDGSVRVAGALSNGDTDCMGQDNYTRVDVYRDWIESYTGPTISGTIPEDSCGTITYSGTCINGVLEWCDGGTVLTRDCEACGEVCVFMDGPGYVCIPDQCNGLDYLGQCNGNIAEWCDNGNFRSSDCATYGKVCGYVNEQLGYYCVDVETEEEISVPPVEPAPEPEPDPEPTGSEESPSACGDLDYYGQCNGDTAEWCADEAIQARDCSEEGLVCGLVSEELGYYCMTPEVELDVCDELDYLGRCNEDLAEWCSDDAIQTRDCALDDQICGYIDSEYGFYCVDRLDCAGLDYLGQCNGAIAEWCQDGVRQRVDCTDYDLSCGYVDSSTGYYCQ